MSGLSSEEIFAVVIVVVVCIALAAVGLLLLNRLRRQRDRLRGELSGRPEAISDRAFNRIAMARREANVLQGQGIEVPRARELVGEAQASFDARQFDRAYELAQSAHETLVAARQRPPPPAANLSLSAAAGPPRSSGSSASPAPASSAPPPAKVPAHRAEAQFQLRLLETDLERAGASSDGRVLRAKALRAEAQQAFDRSDYASAFRLALKGRREAGAPVEAVPAVAAGAPGGPSPGSGAPNTDPAETAAALASSDRCPHCGHPMATDDPFCRGCGVPRG